VQDYRDYEDWQSQHFMKTTCCDHAVSRNETHINGRSLASISTVVGSTSEYFLILPLEIIVAADLESQVFTTSATAK
jgi:hypothetical protein